MLGVENTGSHDSENELLWIKEKIEVTRSYHILKQIELIIKYKHNSNTYLQLVCAQCKKKLLRVR